MLRGATGECEMPYTLAEAARTIGMQKSTVLRAIKRGTLSAVRNASTGQWLVEPAELHRVYPAINGAGASTGASMASAPPRTDALDAENRELRARLGDAHATIDDLRHRLDTETEDRRQAQAQLAETQAKLTAILTDQRQPARRWWAWGRRR
jgi:excisionase family DNA binding protein